MTPDSPSCRDAAAEERVELHAHTAFSAMDACIKPAELVRQAGAWGHRAVAVTDFGGVQGFPAPFLSMWYSLFYGLINLAERSRGFSCLQ